MLLWFVKWGKEHNFLHNIVTLNELRISKEVVHWDNFTIPLVELAWVGLTAMVAIAIAFRRSNFELFYYTHHFAASFLLAAIMHAWSFWYYAGGPVLLWVADRCLRLSKRSTAPVVLAVRGIEQAHVTTIELVGSFRLSFHLRSFLLSACFICFPFGSFPCLVLLEVR